MASRCLELSRVKHNNIVRLNGIMLFPYCSSASGNFLSSVLVQILRIILMIAIDSAIEQFLTAFLLTVTTVDVLRIVEFLQTTVVPAFFLVTDRF